MLHLVISASLADITIDHDHFVESLKVTPDSPDAVALAIKMIGRELTEQDLQSDDVVCTISSVLSLFLNDFMTSRNCMLSLSSKSYCKIILSFAMPLDILHSYVLCLVTSIPILSRGYRKWQRLHCQNM